VLIYLKHLSNALMGVNVDVQEVNRAVLLFDCFDELWLQHLAGVAPAGTGLDHCGLVWIREDVLEVLLCLHLLDVVELTLRREHAHLVLSVEGKAWLAEEHGSE